MIKDSTTVLHELREYASPKAKLTRLLRSGSLVRIRKGLYVEAGDAPVCALAPVIYGPSYLSFEYALAWYGLISERVTSMTSACCGKNRSKRFVTPFGEYVYRDIPRDAYPYGIRREMEGSLPFLIADPEKALCDMVSKQSDVISIRDMKSLLLDDWRMEREDLLRLDLASIDFLAPRYRKRSVRILQACLQAWLKNEVES